MNRTFQLLSLLCFVCFCGCSSESEQDQGRRGADESNRFSEKETRIESQDEKQWSVVSSLGGKVIVDFPLEPRVEVQQRQTETGIAKAEMKTAMDRGIFFKVFLLQLPFDSTQQKDGPLGYMMRVAEGHEAGREGLKRESLFPIDGTSVPAIEHRFTHQGGTNSAGQKFAPGFSIQKSYIIDNVMCTVSVDAVQSAYDSRPEEAQKDIRRFLDSIQLKLDENEQ